MIGNFLNSNKDGNGPAVNMWAFIVLWIGQCVSLLCSGMTCFAQSIYSYTDLGGTITNLAILVVLAQLPGIVLAPVAGLIADRLNRRWIMFACNSIAAATTLVLRSLVVSGHIQIWHMYLLVSIIATANQFQWPAYFATVPTMVPFKHLGRANGMVWTARSLSFIASPAIAAWLVVSIKIQGIVLFDMISYILAAVILLYVYIPPTPRNITTEVGQKSSLLKETFLGWSFLLARPGLVGLLAVFAAANFVYSGTRVLTLPLTLTVASVTTYGMLAMAGGVSGIIGSLIISVWGGPKRRIYGVLGTLALEAIGLILMGVDRSLVNLFFGWSIVALATPLINACSGVVYQSKVPIDMQGRVMAATVMVSGAFGNIGYLMSGWLGDHVFGTILLPGHSLTGSLGEIVGVGKGAGLGLLIAIFGLIQISFVVVGFLYPRLRHLDQELPDAVVAYAKTEAKKQAVGTAWRQIDLTEA